MGKWEEIGEIKNEAKGTRKVKKNRIGSER